MWSQTITAEALKLVVSWYIVWGAQVRQKY